MNIGRRKVQAGCLLLALMVLAVAAHLLAGTTGLLAVVVVVQLVVLAVLLELRARLPREVHRLLRPSRAERRSRSEQRDLLEAHLRTLEDLQQRHSEGQARALHDAVVRLEAAIADASAGGRPGEKGGPPADVE